MTTGYGRVSKMICNAFHAAGHEVHVVGWGYRGEPHSFPYELIKCEAQQVDQFGGDTLPMTIRRVQPDIVFTLADPWMILHMGTMYDLASVKWVSYFPIDGFPVPTLWCQLIEKMDVPVAFSKFTVDLVKSQTTKTPQLIYHGVDTKLFIPLEPKVRKEARAAHGLEGQFVVGTVAKNQVRKNLPALVKAFHRFQKGKPDVKLYMHTRTNAPDGQGWNLEEMIGHLDMKAKCFFPVEFNENKGVTDDQMSTLYNLMDVFVLPTMAEGFGLPILEAQACGIPVLATDFSACSEIIAYPFGKLKVLDTLTMNRNFEQAIVSVDDIVDKLNILYGDWNTGGKLIADLGRQGRQFALGMDWSSITAEFCRLIDSIELKPYVQPSPQFFRM